MVAIVALAGCSQEIGIGDDLPVEPVGQPTPIDLSVQQTDVMVQTTVPDVDILFMVDNSCSMGDDQQRLVDNFPSFMRWFLNSGLDYHIGVVSSDVFDTAQSGKLVTGFGRKWISADDPNQIAMFQQMAVLGVSGSGDERGTDAIYLGLEIERDGFNEGFYRDEAALHVLAVSDEPDNSQIQSTGEFTDWFDSLKQIPDNRSFTSIERPGSNPGYGRITQRIGGVLVDITDSNWAEALDQLGLRATGMKTEYFLSRLPVDDTIVVGERTIIDEGNFALDVFPRSWQRTDGSLVDADGNDVPPGTSTYYYESMRNSILFVNHVPEEANEIEITYTVRTSVVE